jgi:hypothetical protein
MKVKDLIKLLENVDPESTVLIRDNGSILPTDNVDEHADYNHESEGEFYILASEEWEHD